MIRDNINSGTKVTLDNEPIKHKNVALSSVAGISFVNLGTMTDLNYMSLVCHNGNVCGVGYYAYSSSSSYTKYTINIITTNNFLSIRILEYSYALYNSAFVSYKGVIHGFGVNGSGDRYHNICDDNLIRTTTFNNLPFHFSYDTDNVLVYNDNINIICYTRDTTYDCALQIYEWSGEDTDTWSLITTLPINYTTSCKNSAVYNNNIHFISSGSSSPYSHYMWDGETWTELTPPTYCSHYSNNDMFVCNNILYCRNYVYEDNMWVKINDISFYGFAVFPFDDGSVVMFEKINGNTSTDHYERYYIGYGDCYRCAFEK